MTKKIVVVEEFRTAPLGLRIRPSLKSALTSLAADARRPLANYVELVLEDHVEQTRKVGKRQ
jgi:hypothetical protein